MLYILLTYVIICNEYVEKKKRVKVEQTVVVSEKVQPE